MSDEPTLRCDGLSLRFGGVVALDGLDLTFASGEVCGLLGPNGAGKTTLFDCLSGVRAPDVGAVVLDGHDITGRSPTWRARHGIRRTFQRQQTFGRLTVEENVLVAVEWEGGGGGLAADLLRLRPRRSIERRRRQDIGELLERCGLAPVRDVPTCRLPIGAARLVEVARALVSNPRVLLLDEPTSGLDEREVERIAGVVDFATTELGCVVVLVEHDVEFVTALSDVIVVLDRGRVISRGTPEAVKADPAARAIYLGVPTG